jgi:hypothetical protein
LRVTATLPARGGARLPLSFAAFPAQAGSRLLPRAAPRSWRGALPFRLLRQVAVERRPTWRVDVRMQMPETREFDDPAAAAETKGNSEPVDRFDPDRYFSIL